MIRLRIEEARRTCGLSQQGLADALGTSQSAVHRWETGARSPKASTLIEIAEACGTSVSYLFGEDAAAGPSPARDADFPLVSRISVEGSREMFEIAHESVETPESLANGHPRAFWFKVPGNAMNRIVPEGFYVLVDPDTPVRNGDVGIVLVDAEDATMKRVFMSGNSVVLHPESYDPEYRDRTLDTSSRAVPSVRMVGRVVSCRPPLGWRP